MLPIANSCLDYLVRTNIPEKLQGRAWGFIGFLSQVGYILAYGLSGFLADLIGNELNVGVGRGSAIVIQISGALLIVIAIIIGRIKSIHKLEKAN